MSKASGCEHVAVSSFSKLFGDAPLEISEEEAAILGGPGGLMHDFDGGSKDSEIPAGYIFFAQFIDHDITLDTTSNLRERPPLDAAAVSDLPNIRSASLDLDCVYGFGPEASPHIYDTGRPGRLAVNPNGYDLARSPGGVALIGDPRNDENIFVSQMQLLFHRFHNKLYNERVHEEAGESRFETALKATRYHYQWLVLFDFLKRLCDREVYKFAANRLISGQKPLIYAPDAHGALTMPVEFSVAAYRVGHTMVRSQYAVNHQNLDIELFDERFGTLGFSSYPEDLVVDWRYLLDVADCVQPRMSKAIDPLLADEIQDMPRPVVNSNNPNDRALAFRNLLRGNALGLPSGQTAAAALQAVGYPVDPAFDLQLGRVPGWARLDAVESGGGPSRLRDQTPLFYYILRESEIANDGQRFGPVGSAILMEVFGGMLAYCKTSFLNSDPNWNPDPCVSKERWGWWSEAYREEFNRTTLIEDDDYYPFDLADVVRFVQDRDPDGNPVSCCDD
jgi:hypothetical protein